MAYEKHKCEKKYRASFAIAWSWSTSDKINLLKMWHAFNLIHDWMYVL